MNIERTVILANPRGFCAGVIRAIGTVKAMLEEYGAPVFVLHEIVHNRHVIRELEAMGAVFVQHLEDIPSGGIVIFSAHGVSRAIELRAGQLGLRAVNATCPLVTSVHSQVEKRHEEGDTVIIIGHHGHPEVIGTAGRAPDRVRIVASVEEVASLLVDDPARVAFVTQTTLSQNEVAGIREALRERFPSIKGPDSNICYATQNRQNAVRVLAAQVDLLYVVGSKNSSNSNRLREVAAGQGVVAQLIDDAGEIQPDELDSVSRIGITAGASAPERLVQEVVAMLKQHGKVTEVVELPGNEPQVCFPLARLEEVEHGI